MPVMGDRAGAQHGEGWGPPTFTGDALGFLGIVSLDRQEEVRSEAPPGGVWGVRLRPHCPPPQNP